MKLYFLLAAVCLLSRPALADDYMLSDEEEEEFNNPKGEDFMKSFSCLVGTQRLTSAKDSIIKGYSSMARHADKLKRMTANLYKRCMDTMTDELKTLVGAAKSRSDFDRIRFTGIEDFDVDQYFRSHEDQLSPEEAEHFRAYQDIEKKVRDIRKKTMRENPDTADEEEDDQTYDEIKRRNQKPQIGGIDVDSALAKYTVLGFLTILGGFIYLLWKKLFLEESEREKQRALKRQQKKKVKPE